MNRPNAKVADIAAELTEYNAIPGTSTAAARILVANYVGRYESVCDTEEEVNQMVLAHFLSIANDVAIYVVKGNLSPSKDRARAVKIVQYALNELQRIDATEVAMTKMGRVAVAMETWCDLLERV